MPHIPCLAKLYVINSQTLLTHQIKLGKISDSRIIQATEVIRVLEQDMINYQKQIEEINASMASRRAALSMSSTESNANRDEYDDVTVAELRVKAMEVKEKMRRSMLEKEKEKKCIKNLKETCGKPKAAWYARPWKCWPGEATHHG